VQFDENGLYWGLEVVLHEQNMEFNQRTDLGKDKIREVKIIARATWPGMLF
jgi:hypothetical protein